MCCFYQKFFLKNRRKPSIYKGLSHFRVIITRASILLTIPVAFIYKNSFVDLITLLLSVNIGVLYLNFVVEKSIPPSTRVKLYFILTYWTYKIIFNFYIFHFSFALCARILIVNMLYFGNVFSII